MNATATKKKNVPTGYNTYERVWNKASDVCGQRDRLQSLLQQKCNSGDITRLEAKIIWRDLRRDQVPNFD